MVMGAAHLASLRQLDNKLLTAYTLTVAPELGRRAPTFLEAREASRMILIRMLDLVDCQP